MTAFTTCATFVSDFMDDFMGEDATYTAKGGSAEPIKVAPVGEEVIDEDGQTIIRTDSCSVWVPLTYPGERGDLVTITTGAYIGDWVVYQEADRTPTRRLLVVNLKDAST